MESGKSSSTKGIRLKINCLDINQFLNFEKRSSWLLLFFEKSFKKVLHLIWIFVIIIKSANGGVAKWLNAAVCKTALSEFGGSNPPSSIIGISYKVQLVLGYSQVVRQWFLVPSCAGSNPANPIVLKEHPTRKKKRPM